MSQYCWPCILFSFLNNKDFHQAIMTDPFLVDFRSAYVLKFIWCRLYLESTKYAVRVKTSAANIVLQHTKVKLTLNVDKFYPPFQIVNVKILHHMVYPLFYTGFCIQHQGHHLLLQCNRILSKRISIIVPFIALLLNAPLPNFETRLQKLASETV